MTDEDCFNENHGYLKRLDLRFNKAPDEPVQWLISNNELCNEIDDFEEEMLVKKLFNYKEMTTNENSIFIHDCKLDSLEIIDYFCKCHHWGVYPPAWLMDEITSRFANYLADNLKGKTRRLGEYFGEPANGNCRGKFREAASPDMRFVCLYVDKLEYWFSRPLNKALDIVAVYYEKLYKEKLRGWNVKKGAGRESIRKAHQKSRRYGTTRYMIKIWEKHPPTTESRINLLITLGRDSLTGHPDLLDILDKAEKEGITKWEEGMEAKFF